MITKIVGIGLLASMLLAFYNRKANSKPIQDLSGLGLLIFGLASAIILIVK